MTTKNDGGPAFPTPPAQEEECGSACDRRAYPWAYGTFYTMVFSGTAIQSSTFRSDRRALGQVTQRRVGERRTKHAEYIHGAWRIRQQSGELTDVPRSLSRTGNDRRKATVGGVQSNTPGDGPNKAEATSSEVAVGAPSSPSLPHCASCGDDHYSHTMCPPHEVRVTGAAWVREHAECDSLLQPSSHPSVESHDTAGANELSTRGTDIVPVLRLSAFTKAQDAADEIERLRDQVKDLEEVVVYAADLAREVRELGVLLRSDPRHSAATGWRIWRIINGTPYWWTGFDRTDWGYLDTEAVHFSRKRDAEKVIALLGIQGVAVLYRVPATPEEEPQ